MREGGDAALFAHGAMLEAAMDAADALSERGISVKVINCAVMKPFDYTGFAKLCEGAGAVATAEEHTYIGGLASAAALSLRESRIPMDFVAVMDTFGQSARSAAELYEYYGLTSDNIAKKIIRLLRA